MRNYLHFTATIILLFHGTFSLAAPTTNPAGAASTRPVTPEEAVYRNNVGLVQLLMDDPTEDELLHLGRHYRASRDYPRAALVHLTALRSKHDDPMLEYELACDFSLWRQKKLGMEYFQKAADHGYWGYRIVVDDTDVNALKADPSFGASLDKIKTSFAIEAPKNAPGITIKIPKGDAPGGGWPVLFLLHGWGSTRHDFDSDAQFVSTLGYVGITLDANEVMGPGAYTWGNTSVEPTNDRIQAAIKNLTVPINPKRIYIHGFSQGAMHAARLIADHPDLYAGAISNSPGPIGLIPTKLANSSQTGTIVLSIGTREAFQTKTAVDKIQKLWEDNNRPVHVIHFTGVHQLPPDQESMFRTALEQLSAAK